MLKPDLKTSTRTLKQSLLDTLTSPQTGIRHTSLPSRDELLVTNRSICDVCPWVRCTDCTLLPRKDLFTSLLNQSIHQSIISSENMHLIQSSMHTSCRAGASLLCLPIKQQKYFVSLGTVHHAYITASKDYLTAVNPSSNEVLSPWVQCSLCESLTGLPLCQKQGAASSAHGPSMQASAGAAGPAPYSTGCTQTSGKASEHNHRP